MTPYHDQLCNRWLVGCTAGMLRKHPLAVSVLDKPLVFFRADDHVVVAEDRCPHRNAPLSLGTLHANRLRCPYHGWCFDAQGRCVEAPGILDAELPQASLRMWRAQQRDGLVWVAPPQVPADRSFYRPKLADDKAYRGFDLSADIEADLADALENLLDGTHTPYVHSGLVRSPGRKQEFTATVRRHDEMVEAEYRGESGQAGLISRWFEPEREASVGRYIPPFTAELEYRSRRRVELLVVAHFTPRCEGRLGVFITCYLPRGWLPAAAKFAIVSPFFRRVLNQDRKILKLQQQNVSRFGERAYTVVSGDLMRPWIDAWLRNGVFPAQPRGAAEFRFSL